MVVPGTSTMLDTYVLCLMVKKMNHFSGIGDSHIPTFKNADITSGFASIVGNLAAHVSS